jgi:hypothetical protein
VVIPSSRLRRNIVAQLITFGYQVRATGSFDEAVALIEGSAIDTLVLDTSAFLSTALARLARAMRRRRSLRLIAGMSVFTVAGAERCRTVGERAQRSATPGHSPWHVATYWLAFSPASRFSADLRGANLN